MSASNGGGLFTCGAKRITHNYLFQGHFYGAPTPGHFYMLYLMESETYKYRLTN
jgi:hypothetical protein